MNDLLAIAVLIGAPCVVLALDYRVSERRRTREARDAVRRAIGSDVAVALAFRPSAALPWRVAYAGSVWGFADSASLGAFLRVFVESVEHSTGYAPHPVEFGAVFAEHPSRLPR